jgi:hypothetical protein
MKYLAERNYALCRAKKANREKYLAKEQLYRDMAASREQAWLAMADYWAALASYMMAQEIEDGDVAEQP